MKRPLFLPLFLLLIFPFLTGCGNSGLKGLYPVKGKITHKGVPIADVTVTFIPVTVTETSRAASGRTDSEGIFTISTLKANDGAYPGDYKVTLQKMEAGMPPEIMITSNNPYYENILPKKYHDAAAQDGLRFSVKNTRNNELLIDIPEDLLDPLAKWNARKKR